jgi:hypothetical protein
MVALLKDRRGVVAIQVALFLPILVIVLLGMFELWKVLYIKQAMDDAAYQGARFLSMQPRFENEVRVMTYRYLASNNFVAEYIAADPNALRIGLDTNDTRCGDTVQVIIEFDWVTGRNPGGGGDFQRPREDSWFRMDFLGRLGTITSAAASNIICDRIERE